MIRFNLPRVAIALVVTTLVLVSLPGNKASGQRRRQARHFSVCGNPNLPCKSVATFEPHDLPIRIPRNAVIWDTELFYAIMLKSVKSPGDSCDVFVPESERLAAQALFPDHKVFSSRCAEPGQLYYTNTSPKAHFMAVYAGTTLAEAKRMLAAVKATGKFTGATVRRMRAGFNGT